jgi:hypothetical protein
VFGVYPSKGLGQSAEPTALRDYYSTPGLNPFEERINDSFNESISPFNGILQFTNTDVFLPGNGGMDIRVVRRYQSSVEERNVKQVYGYGWEISFGEMRFSSGNVLDSNNCTTAAGLFDTKDNPVFITPGGSSELLVANDGSMASASGAVLVSKGRYKLACEPVEPPATGNVWVVYSPDGMRYRLGYGPQAIDTQKSRLFVDRISDANGNSIQIDYATNGNFIVYITSVYDPGDGRTVDFAYTDENTNDIRLETISTSTQTWSYEYQSIYDYNDAAGALDGFLSYPDFDNYHLLRVVRPDGEKWEYEYNVEELVPGETSIYQKWHHLLRGIRYPYGGNIEYTYQDVFFGQTSPFYADPHQVVKTKSINISGNDRIFDTPEIITGDENSWIYSFFPGQGTLEGQGQPVGDLTIVQSPYGTESYLHYGYEHTQEGDIWKIGLLISKSVMNDQGEALYIENNTWEPQAISTEAYWNGRDPNFRDSATNAPLLASKSIAQHGLLYTTDFSNHDGFGNPVNIVKGGSSVADTIDTTASYFVDTDLWIVNRTQNETTVDVGTVTREFDANGNLEQQNNYGVVTNFTYTPEGDLATETDANNQVTTYSDYYRGIARQIEYPEGKVVTRVVNDTGTVDSETNGRGYITRYDYDVMDRLSAIDFPIHSDATITYSREDDRLVRTLIRGNFRETTRFNSLMSPVRTEKTDLTTGTTITTVNEFDLLGRQRFASKPSYGDYPTGLTQQDRDQFGVTTFIDALGREIEVRNPDGSQRFTRYHNQNGPVDQPDAGSVRIIDERGNVTVNRFIGYGSPDDNRLVRIEAPESMTTVADYDKLRNITRIWQGQQGGTGVERLYNFDSRFFLVSEDHPEIGHLVFGRDNVGNMTSRQVRNSDIPGDTRPDSEVTIYTFDGLNRLKTIDYPGSTPDVAYDYDHNDNLTAVDNANSTRIYGYDENDNLSHEDITISSDAYTLSYGYDNLDFLDTITYPSGRSVIYRNDAFGRPIGIVNFVDDATYFPGGQKQSLTYANGMVTTFTLNEREWTESIRLDSDQDSGLIDLTYLYDGRGNVEQIVDGLDINTRVMTYDGLDRLKTADGMWGSGSFDYDFRDNMTSRSIGGNDDVYVIQDNRMAQLQRNGVPFLTPSYDVYGNQLDTPQHDLLFDDASNLIFATKVSGTTAPDMYFRYDGNNRRVERQIGQLNGDIRHYVYSRGDVVFSEIDFPTASIKENIYLGSQIVASVKSDADDPVASIALQPSALEKVLVGLDGTGSFDPGGAIVDYQWSQVAGTPVAIVDLGAGLAEFETPIVAFNETLVFELVVTDDEGNSASTVAGIEVIQTDTDGDTISDLWEEIYFPGNLAQMDASSDFDNDGIIDVDEFRGGTHPINFDALDAPDGILVTTGVTSVDLAWPAVPRANRYAVYTSSTPQVPITESNRTYTSSSPFVQEDLNNGQYLYYVIVAERLDIDGNLLGDSSPSDTVAVKVGWNTWPQRIVHTTQFVSDPLSLEINAQGDVAASWIPADTFVPVYSSYTQQGGWTTATTTPPDKGLNDPDIRVVGRTDGIYAQYYVEGSGWTNDELLQGGAGNEWLLYEQAFNSNGEGLVVIGRLTTATEYRWLRYSPQTGWTSPQALLLSEPPGGSVSPMRLFIADNGAGQMLLAELDSAGDYTTGAIAYDPAAGWQGQVSLGFPFFFPDFLEEDLLIAASDSGYLHLVAIDSGSTIISRHFIPGSGWSGVLTVDDQFALANDGSFVPPMDLELDSQGNGVLVYREQPGTGLTLREFHQSDGWQEAIVRPDPVGCDYDDYMADIEDFFGDDPPTRRDFNPDYYITLDLEINDLGDWSIVSSLRDFSPRSSAVWAARRDAQAGWLEDVILHCPYLHYGTSRTELAQAMNASGTTFVIWTYADNGEILSNPKVLSNKFEMQKGIPPVADAGTDQTVTEGDEVFLDASQSSDPDNEIVAYQWMQVGGTPVNIADGDTALATFIAPLVAADETLTFEVTVTDESGNQASDSVDVTVTDFSSVELGVILGSSSAGPLTTGDSLSLSAQASGGNGGAYEYQFRFKSLDETAAGWTQLQAFGSADNTTWDTTDLGGKYRLQVRVREVGNESVVVRDAISIWVNSAAPLTAVMLESDTIGPQLEGFVAALTAAPAGSGDPVEYRFELKNEAISPDWILLRDYGADPALAWSSSGYIGKNRIRVFARRAGTLDKPARDALRIWINPADAVTSVLLSPSLFSPQPSGTVITFDTVVTGGNGNIEYRFSTKDTTGLAEWVVAQNWSAAASFAWDTTGIYGKQRIRAEARNAGSGDREVADRMSYWLNDDNPLADVELQVDQPKVIVVGPDINLTAVPDGTTSLYEYQFLVKGGAPTASWSVLRDFSPDSTFSVSSTAFLGKNRFQVRARNQGTLDKEVRDGQVVWVNHLDAITDIALSASDTDVVWGETITFNLSFTGGDGTYYLAKELKNPGEEFSGNEYFRAMSTDSFDFYVGGMLPGTYRMRVQAINHELDKPVKSNSVRFTVSESNDPAWQIGGENYDDIQQCTIYECICAVIGGCYNGGEDDGVFGGGY